MTRSNYKSNVVNVRRQKDSSLHQKLFERFFSSFQNIFQVLFSRSKFFILWLPLSRPFLSLVLNILGYIYQRALFNVCMCPNYSLTGNIVLSCELFLNNAVLIYMLSPFNRLRYIEFGRYATPGSSQLQFLAKMLTFFNLELLKNGGSSIAGSGGQSNVREVPLVYIITLFCCWTDSTVTYRFVLR